MYIFHCQLIRHLSINYYYKTIFSLINFIGILNAPLKISEIIEISCDLVVRDEANPHRIIGFFEVFQDNDFINFTPTHLLNYKLRVFDISSLELKFRGLTSDQNLEFSQVAFQIKIEQTYARFQ